MEICISNIRYIVIAIITIIFFVTQYSLYQRPNVYSSHLYTRYNNSATVSVTTLHEKRTPKNYTVLVWTPFFRKYRDWPQFKHLKCKYQNCEVTSNRSQLSLSDTVLFHWRDINVNDIPSKHYPNQSWILLNRESPIYSPYKSIIPLANQINWTMTYRRDSDIFAPYGQIVKCDNSNWKPKFNFSEKVKNVAWIVSRCNAHSGRGKYVQKLQKYIDVDIYGHCGKFHCKRNPSCLENISRDYKFYLSFENSIYDFSKDYVTEKLFKVAKYDIIPVVLGGANYSEILPHNSYIDIFNFSSPKELAAYLQSVASDRVKYNSYLMWKQNYCIINTSWEYFCDICEMLNKPIYNAKRTSLTNWWFRDGKCRKL